MARSMWKGVISFGMVSIPIRLYIATESHSVSFRQLCPEHLAPIHLRRWCTESDHEVPYGEIVRGLEVSPGKFVILEDQDLEKLPLPTSHQVEIQEFIPRGALPTALYLKAAYYTEPVDLGLKPYALLREALARTETLAVAKIAMRDREHLCALQPFESGLLLNTLNWPDEIRPAVGMGDTQEPKVSARELEMAVSLVRNLTEDSFDPSRFQDDYRLALDALVQAKLAGGEVADPSLQAAPVLDLMEALQASVAAAKSRREAAQPAESPRPAARRSRKAS